MRILKVHVEYPLPKYSLLLYKVCNFFCPDLIRNRSGVNTIAEKVSFIARLLIFCHPTSEGDFFI